MAEMICLYAFGGFLILVMLPMSVIVFALGTCAYYRMPPEQRERSGSDGVGRCIVGVIGIALSVVFSFLCLYQGSLALDRLMHPEQRVDQREAKQEPKAEKFPNNIEKPKE